MAVKLLSVTIEKPEVITLISPIVEEAAKRLDEASPDRG
jgi:hypothetical protein